MKWIQVLNMRRQLHGVDIYQGYVAIYVVLKQICRLLSSPDALDKETIGLTYKLEVENWEDVAIVREDENGKTYLPIHQVTNRLGE